MVAEVEIMIKLEHAKRKQIKINRKITYEPTDLVLIVPKTFPRKLNQRLLCCGGKGSTLRFGNHGNQEIWTTADLMRTTYF